MSFPSIVVAGQRIGGSLTPFSPATAAAALSTGGNGGASKTHPHHSAFQKIKFPSPG
jgi:hypothetical protein